MSEEQQGAGAAEETKTADNPNMGLGESPTEAVSEESKQAELDAIWESFSKGSDGSEGSDLIEARKESDGDIPVSSEKHFLEDAAEGNLAEEDSEEVEASAEAAEEPEAPVFDGPTLTFKAGDAEYELPEDATITVTVDGEDMEVPLKEIKNGLSGQKAIAKRFTALDGMRKAVEQREQYFENVKSEVLGLLEKGKPAQAITSLFKEAGVHPEQAFLQLFEQIMPQLEQYSKLTPAQRKLYKERVAAERNRMQAESARKEVEGLRAEKEQLNRIREVQKTYGLSDGDFAHLYDSLEKEMEAGSLPKEVITPEKVGGYFKLIQRESMADKALAAAVPELKGNREAIAKVSEAIQYAEKNGARITQEYVNDLITRAYQTGLEQENAKANGKAPRKAPPKKAAKPDAAAHKRAAPQAPTHQHWLGAFNEELQKAQKTGGVKDIVKKWNK